MNLSLLDPFAVAKEYPETLSHTLQYGHSVTFNFNYKGDYLASGLSDGSIVIYDLSSNGSIIAYMEKDSHCRPVTSISWSSCGRYLLTASQDWCCKLWDLSLVNSEADHGNSQSAVIRQIQCDGPIWQANLSPEDPFKFIAALFEDIPIFVDANDADNIKIVSLESLPLQLKAEQTEGDSSTKTKDRHMTLVSIFTPNDGKYIFTGTNKGWVNIFLTETQELIHSVKFTNSNIKSLVILPNGRKLAINSSDRVIRQVNIPDLVNDTDPSQWEFEIEHKYQDVVNRLQWNSVSFNHNGELLVASTFGQQSSQDLYMWETSMGTLIKILEGSSEELIEVKWNYSKCMIGSNGIEYGVIYLWSVQFPQKWSALAPDFVEVEENIEYEEKEDEFDIIDDDVLQQRRLEEEDSHVDIITKENLDARGFDIGFNSFTIPINYETPIVSE